MKFDVFKVSFHWRHRFFLFLIFWGWSRNENEKEERQKNLNSAIFLSPDRRRSKLVSGSDWRVLVNRVATCLEKLVQPTQPLKKGGFFQLLIKNNFFIKNFLLISNMGKNSCGIVPPGNPACQSAWRVDSLSPSSSLLLEKIWFTFAPFFLTFPGQEQKCGKTHDERGKKIDRHVRR